MSCSIHCSSTPTPPRRLQLLQLSFLLEHASSRHQLRPVRYGSHEQCHLIILRENLLSQVRVFRVAHTVNGKRTRDSPPRECTSTSPKKKHPQRQKMPAQEPPSPAQSGLLRQFCLHADHIAHVRCVEAIVEISDVLADSGGNPRKRLPHHHATPEPLLHHNYECLRHQNAASSQGEASEPVLSAGNRFHLARFTAQTRARLLCFHHIPPACCEKPGMSHRTQSQPISFMNPHLSPER